MAISKPEDVGETEHLLRSPKNAERLFKAIERAKAGAVKPQTVEELRKELGLDLAD
jgi:antitoxin YefM